MADWAQLPVDLLSSIIKKLHVLEYIRFGAVCTSWNTLSKESNLHPKIEPWMLLPNITVAGAKFLSPGSGDTLVIPLKCASYFGSQWTLFGTCHGRLIFYHSVSRAVQLVNPINGAEIQLPCMEKQDISKATLIDFNDKGFSVVAIYRNKNGFAVTKRGDNRWSSVESQSRLADVIKHNGQLYTVDIYGSIELWAEPRQVWNSGNFPQQFNNYRQPMNFLVESPAGDLMRVEKPLGTAADTWFRVYLLDESTFTWASVDDIGEMALFICRTNAVCVSVRDNPGLRASSIYFVDSYHNLCLFNLTLKFKEFIKCLDPKSLQPLLPHQWQHRQPENYVWFVPSLK